MHGCLGESGLARRGRKRKLGKRHPSGQLVREKQPDDRIRTSRQPHRRGLEQEDRLSEKAEAPLGRLNLKDEITNEQYSAGSIYAAVVGDYRSVIEAPRFIGGSGKGFECASEGADPIERKARIGSVVVTMRQWPCGQTDDGCTCARRKARYDSAFESLVSSAGQRAAKAVARVAIFREDIAAQDLVYLKLGLDALAKHFGLIDRRRSRYS